MNSITRQTVIVDEQNTQPAQINIAVQQDTTAVSSAENAAQAEAQKRAILTTVIDSRFGLTVQDMVTAGRNGPLGMAQILTQHLYKNRFASEGCGAQATFYKCDGGLWSMDERGEHRDADHEFCAILKRAHNELYKSSSPLKTEIAHISSAISKVQSPNTFSSIISRATQGVDGCCVPEDKWDQDILTLTTPEGIIDLKTGESREVLPSDYRRRCTSVSLPPQSCAEEPSLWLSTLRESFKPIGMPEKPDDAELKEAGKSKSEAETRLAQLHERIKPAVRQSHESALATAKAKLAKAQQEYDAALRAYEESYARWESGEYLEQTIAFLQRFLGYCLRGDNREQKFIVFIGDKGRNGKGIICHTLRDILGAYADEVRSEMFMKGRQKDSGTPTPEIMALKGKRIVIGSENDRGDALNASLIKRVTGGDYISGRSLYKNEQSFKPSCVPILLTNYFPHIDTEDQALLTRCLCLCFQRTFVERPDPENIYEGQIDTQLEAKLRAEYPAILAWIVQGAVLYEQEGKLTVPEFLKTSGESYRESKDIIGAFLKDCCTTEPDPHEPDALPEVTASALYGAYSQWCDEKGLKAVSAPTFKERLASKGYKQRKRSSMFYLGIALNEEGTSLSSAYFDRKRPHRF